MSILPDELWAKILESGTANSQFTHRDLCSVSIVSRQLNRLSADQSLWSLLLSLHFSNSADSSTPPSKSLYRLRFERDKARRHAAWRRDVLITESNLVVRRHRLKELEQLILKESQRLRDTVTELNNLERVRRATVALNVWQPEVVRGSHKQIIEQRTLPIEFRFSVLNMEIKVCNQQIAIYNKTYNYQKMKLKEGEEALKSLKYHPMQSYQPGAGKNDCNMKRKKLKKINT